MSADAQSTNRDRPARNPGGVECAKCACVFIGEEWHAFCRVCLEEVTVEIAEVQHSKSQTTILPDPPRAGCWFCDGTGITNQRSYDQACADGFERKAFKPGTRCMCTYSLAEISRSVAEILTEVVADGKR